jgi:hypothetical protein
VRVRLEHRETLDGLVALLQFDPDAIVTAIDDDEVEVSYVGSLSERAQRERLEMRLRSWLHEWQLADDVAPDAPP